MSGGKGDGSTANKAVPKKKRTSSEEQQKECDGSARSEQERVATLAQALDATSLCPEDLKNVRVSYQSIVLALTIDACWCSPGGAEGVEGIDGD